MTIREQAQFFCIVAAGCGFGHWRGSFGAGLFMGILMFMLLMESDDWRNAVKRRKS